MTPPKLILALLLSQAIQYASAFEPTTYDHHSIRAVTSFDVGPTKMDGKFKVSYTNQGFFQKILKEDDRLTYLEKAYFSGTVESKAYALFGLRILESPKYEKLKLDFLRLEKLVTVDCRIDEDSKELKPSELIKLIESKALSNLVKTKGRTRR